MRKIVALCRREGIDLRLFITPEHAHQMEITAAVGEWSAVEEGKRELARILAEDAANHPGARSFIAYDFSGYSLITTETVPPRGSRTEMAYYWDSSHFKEIVGDFVLDRLFGTADTVSPVPEDFGRPLSADTVEQLLSEIRVGHMRYHREHPSDVAMIEGMVTAARARIALRPIE